MKGRSSQQNKKNWEPQEIKVLKIERIYVLVIFLLPTIVYCDRTSTYT